MAINLKKKAGRPAKEKTTPAKVVVKKSKLELDYENACNKIDALKEDSDFYESKLYEERKNLEDLFKELDKCIYSTIHHCSQVECTTGKLTLHDVDYCVDLIKRVMKHKFEYKFPNIES
jgi:hypothetical protein